MVTVKGLEVPFQGRNRSPARSVAITTVDAVTRPRSVFTSADFRPKRTARRALLEHERPAADRSARKPNRPDTDRGSHDPGRRAHALDVHAGPGLTRVQNAASSPTAFRNCHSRRNSLSSSGVSATQ